MSWDAVRHDQDAVRQVAGAHHGDPADRRVDGVAGIVLLCRETWTVRAGSSVSQGAERERCADVGTLPHARRAHSAGGS